MPNKFKVGDKVKTTQFIGIITETGLHNGAGAWSRVQITHKISGEISRLGVTSVYDGFLTLTEPREVLTKEEMLVRKAKKLWNKQQYVVSHGLQV